MCKKGFETETWCRSTVLLCAPGRLPIGWCGGASWRCLGMADVDEPDSVRLLAVQAQKKPADVRRVLLGGRAISYWPLWRFAYRFGP